MLLRCSWLTPRSGADDRPVDRTTRPRRHPAQRTRRAVGAASVAGFAAIGGAVALGTDATASTPTTVTSDQATSETTSSATPEWRRGGPVAGSSGAAAPDASSHGS